MKKYIIASILLICAISISALEHCVAKYEKGGDGFEYYFLKDTVRNTVGVMLMSGDTLFQPVYGGICYSWRDNWSYFLVHDSLCHAGVYTRSGKCIIPESRGYDEILDERSKKCFAWNCYKQNQTEKYYIVEVCDWMGNVVFKPKQRYVEMVPIYDHHRIFFHVRRLGKEHGNFFIDLNEKKCVLLEDTDTPKTPNLLPFKKRMFK